MKVDYSTHYDENYFYPNFKEWVDEFGVTRKYYGPSRSWHGFSYIARFIKDHFEGTNTVLDIGCGAGSFVAHALREEMDCVGIDISRFAVTNPVEGAEGKLRIADITRENPTKQYDLVTGFDFMEHIYQHDIGRIYQYLNGSVRPGGYVFLCIATAQNDSELWAHSNKEAEVPREKNWLAIAGHVYIRYMEDWIHDLEQSGIRPDYEKMMRFALWKVKHQEMKTANAWSINNVFIGRKQ